MASGLALISPALMSDLQHSHIHKRQAAKRRFSLTSVSPTRSSSPPYDLKKVKVEQPDSPVCEPDPVPLVSSTTSSDEVTTTTTETDIAQPTATDTKPDEAPPMRKTKKQQTLSEYVLACLANYGMCVLDHFMGLEKATNILNEVEELDKSGVLVSGKTVQKQDEVKNVRKVRQDRIAFVEKNSSRGIDDLVSKVDTLLTHVQVKSKTYPDYADKELFDVSGRTRAMVSCYPGNGTHYVRHVDNHHRDGRCITVVYYLNKDWDVKEHGGLLKVYPQLVHPRVANIVPIIDRILLFWSDERNPHEVLPAFRNRYAITVWYFDREERRKALAQHQSLGEASSTTA